MGIIHEGKRYVYPSEFYTKMGITRPSFKSAEEAGRIKRTVINGRSMYAWEENRRSFIETSPFPDRFIDKNYFKNKKLAGETSSKYYDDDDDIRKGKHPIDDIEEPLDKDGEFRPHISRFEADAVKQVYLAKQAKLKFLKSAGILIETALVQKEWEDIAYRVQKSMLSIPDRVAEIFATMTDASKIHQDLTIEIRHALSSLQYEINLEEDHEDIKKFINGDEEEKSSGETEKEIEDKDKEKK